MVFMTLARFQGRIPAYYFLISDSLIFALIFMISFFLLILGFVFSFPGSFGYNVCLIFFLFPEVKFYYYKHSS